MTGTIGSPGARLADDLRSEGHSIVRGAVDRHLIAQIDQDLRADFDATPFCRGLFYGERTKRFGGLLKRTKRAERLVRHPAILAAVEDVLAPWCEMVQLNLAQAIAVHPGAAAQAPHRDQARFSRLGASRWRRLSLAAEDQQATR